MRRPRPLRRFRPQRRSWSFLLLLATLIFAVQGGIQPLHDRMMAQMGMADSAPGGMHGMDMGAVAGMGMGGGDRAPTPGAPASHDPGNSCCACGCCAPLTAGLPPTLTLPVRVEVRAEALPLTVRRARLLALRATARGPPVMAAV